MNAPRKFTAILAAGVASYSGPTGPDEEGTPKRHRKLRRKLVNSAVSLDRGRIAKATGDGILIEFPSWMFAAPLDVQRRMEGGNADTPDDRRIEFEIGINPCDVAVEGDPRSTRVRMLPRLWRVREKQGTRGDRHARPRCRRFWAHIGVHVLGGQPWLVASATFLRGSRKTKRRFAV